MSQVIVSAKWGCHRCTEGGNSKNAVMVAARHAKASNHPTWAEETRKSTFGPGSDGVKDRRQGGLL